MKHSRRMEDEEQHHAADAQQDDDHAQPHENGGRPERRCRNGIEVRQLPFTDNILPVLDHPARLPQPEVAGPLAVWRVAQPVGLDKDDDHDDGEADGEDTPQNPDGL